MQIVGTAGMGAVFGLISFATVIAGIALFIAAAATQSAALMITVAVGFVFVLMAIALISSTLGGIYAAAVYRFAAEGDAGTFFSADLVRGAFQKK